MPSDVSAKTTLSNETLFRIANSMSLLVSLFTTLQSYHAFANPHFRVHSTNLLYTIEITCWTIWLDPPNAWQSLRHAGYIYTRPFCCAFYWKQYMCRMRSGDETTRVLADSSIFQKGYEWWASSRWSTSFQKNILIGDFNEEWLREVVLDQPDSSEPSTSMSSSRSGVTSF